MIDTVPKGVELTEVIEPLPMKPQNMFLTYMGDGTLQLSSEIRVCHILPYDVESS